MHLSKSLEMGAELLTGGKRPPALNRGNFIEPTIVRCDHQDYPIVQNELFGQYDEILASSDDARVKLERAVRVSFEAIDKHPHEVAIFQNDADHLGSFERFGYLADRNIQSRQVWVTLIEEGMRTGVLRPDLDVTLTYRFIRDTVWVAVRWYRPGRGLTHTDIADQYVRILLDGIAQPSRRK
jgi:hypothetical protein